MLFSPKRLISERSSAFTSLRLANVGHDGADIGVADAAAPADGAEVRQPVPIGLAGQRHSGLVMKLPSMCFISAHLKDLPIYPAAGPLIE